MGRVTGKVAVISGAARGQGRSHARMLAAERFKRGNIQASLTIEAQEGSRGLRIDPEALAAAVRIAKQIADETGLQAARVDGAVAIEPVQQLPLSLGRRQGNAVLKRPGGRSG